MLLAFFFGVLACALVLQGAALLHQCVERALRIRAARRRCTRELVLQE